MKTRSYLKTETVVPIVRWLRHQAQEFKAYMEPLSQTKQDLIRARNMAPLVGCLPNIHRALSFAPRISHRRHSGT